MSSSSDLSSVSYESDDSYDEEEPLPRKEKRPYKKRKHKTPLSGAGGLGSSTGVPGRTSVSSTSVTAGLNSASLGTESLDLEALSSDDGEASSGLMSAAAVSDDDDSGADGSEGPFVFRRRRNCSYHAPLALGQGNWPWCSREEGGLADRRYRFCLTSLATPPPGRCVGFSRRRVGRGGRVVLDRVATPMDDVFSSSDFTIFDSEGEYSGPSPLKRYKRPVRRVSKGKTANNHPQPSEPTQQEADESTTSNEHPNQNSQNEIVTKKDDPKIQHTETSETEVHQVNKNETKVTRSTFAATKVERKGHTYERYLDEKYQNVSGTEQFARLTYEKYLTPEAKKPQPEAQNTQPDAQNTQPEAQNTQLDVSTSQEPLEPNPALQQILEEFDNTEFLNEVRSEWLHFKPVPANNETNASGTSGDPEPVIDWNNSNSLIDWSNLHFDFEFPDGSPSTEMSFFDLFYNMPAGVMDPSFFGLPADFNFPSRWASPDSSGLIRDDLGVQMGRQNFLSHQSNAEASGSSSSSLLPNSNEADDDKYRVGCSKFVLHSGPKPCPPQLWANISSSLHQAPGPGRPGGTTSNRTAHQHRKRERHHQHSQNYSFYNAAATTSSPSNPPLSNGVSIIPVSVSAVLSANPGLLRQGLSNGPAGPSSGTVVSSSSRRRAIPVFIKQEVVEEAPDLNEQFNCVSFASGSGSSPGESTAAGICVSPATADSSSAVAAAAAAAAAACSEQQKLKSSTTSQQQVLMEVT